MAEVRDSRGQKRSAAVDRKGESEIRGREERKRFAQRENDFQDDPFCAEILCGYIKLLNLI